MIFASLALSSGCVGRNVKKSGEGGIRTLGRISPTPVFETGPIGRSGTSPGVCRRARHSVYRASPAWQARPPLPWVPADRPPHEARPARRDGATPGPEVPAVTGHLLLLHGPNRDLRGLSRSSPPAGLVESRLDDSRRDRRTVP